SLGSNFYFADFYSINGNYSWNVLNTKTDDPIIPAFNTPEHKFNIGISGRNVPLSLFGQSVQDFGFSVNYKWVDSFIFEGSPQFTGPIPAYGMLDAQLNFAVPSINTTIKIGASNILDNQVFQVYGGPRIGRLAYLSATYNFVKK
ncbi:MAG: TonB-dependent receptor, partial [Bacteroidota bacterium]